MKVTLDSEVCMGHGLCYMTAPTMFTDDEQGYGSVLGDGQVSAELAAAARLGAGSCPERAITIIDDEGADAG